MLKSKITSVLRYALLAPLIVGGFPLLCAANENQYDQPLQCTLEQKATFQIVLFKPSDFGPIHCIHGLPIADMTSCSPDGGWGLSYPTGTAGLSETTSSWAIAYEHFGGKFASHLSPDEFVAQATFGLGIEVEPRNGSQDMKLSLNRLTGEGVLLLGSDQPQEFSCEVVERKF